jgi:hypothetical protein
MGCSAVPFRVIRHGEIHVERTERVNTTMSKSDTSVTINPRECPCVMAEDAACEAGEACFHFGGAARCTHCGQQESRRTARPKRAWGTIQRLEWFIREIDAACEGKPPGTRWPILVSRNDAAYLRRVLKALT